MRLTIILGLAAAILTTLAVPPPVPLASANAAGSLEANTHSHGHKARFKAILEKRGWPFNNWNGCDSPPENMDEYECKQLCQRCRRFPFIYYCECVYAEEDARKGDTRCDGFECGEGEDAAGENQTEVARNQTDVMEPHPGGRKETTIDLNQGLSFGDGE